MSAISVLQTPPCSPRRLEKEDTTSSEFHQKTDDTQQEKTEVLQTPPPTPRYDDDIEFHATEKDASTNDTADCQADPSLGCTEELKVPHANAQVEGLEVSLNSPSTLSSHGGSKDNTEDVVSAVSTGNAQDERTIVKKKEDNPDSTRVTTDHTTRTEDAKESFTSEPARQSEKDEQKDTDHVASAGEFTNRLSKNPEQVEKAKVEILPPKVEAKETSLSIPVTATQVISSALVQQQPEQLIRVIKPGYESTRFGKHRCQGTTKYGVQCKWESDCRYHGSSNTYSTLKAALAGRDGSLCRGVTKAMTLCKNLAQSCEHPEHRGERGITKGDIFRAHLLTLKLTRATRKLYFITEREVNIELVKGWSMSPVSGGPSFRKQLMSRDLYPTNARPKVHREVSACIDNFVRKVEEITSSYGEFIKLSIFHTIHEHLSNFKNATVFSRDDEKTLRPFATGYVYFTIYTPGSFQYYDEDFISNSCVVIKNGVCRDVQNRFKGRGGHEERCGIDPKHLRSFPDKKKLGGVPFAWLLESILHCFSRAHQFTFQCNRPSCVTRHEEMFLYKLLHHEDVVAGFHAVVDHLEREIKIEDWIQALYILMPLQEYFEELVV